SRGVYPAWCLDTLVVNAINAVTLLLVIAGWLSAPWIARTFAPEYALVPGKLELTTLLIRIMLPFLTLIAIAVAMMGMLNALRRVFIPAVAPPVFNVAALIPARALVPPMPRLGLARLAAATAG